MDDSFLDELAKFLAWKYARFVVGHVVIVFVVV